MLTENILIIQRSPTVICVSGRDAERYLHGRLSQNIKGLKAGQGAKSLLLTPQGRIQAQLIVLRLRDSFLLVSDPLGSEEERKALTAALLQFKVADDVTLEDLSSQVKIASLLGEKAFNYFPELERKQFSHQQNPSSSFWPDSKRIHTAFVCLRGEVQGVDLIVTNTEQPIPNGVQLAEPQELELIRIRACIPLMGKELSEKVLAPEIDLSDLVSFEKGCYAGQEVVEMATARGRANRILCMFSGQSEVTPAEGSEILACSEGELSVSCGQITSIAPDLESKNFFALGFIKATFLESSSFFVHDKSGKAIALKKER